MTEVAPPALILEPAEELVFRDKLGHVSGVPLLVRNKNMAEVYFKIKSTASKFYSVRPSSGRIKPFGHVKVIIQPHDDSQASLDIIEAKKHRFMVQCAYVDPQNAVEAELFWKNADESRVSMSVARIRAKVNRVQPMPSVVNNNNEANQGQQRGGGEEGNKKEEDTKTNGKENGDGSSDRMCLTGPNRIPLSRKEGTTNGKPAAKGVKVEEAKEETGEKEEKAGEDGRVKSKASKEQQKLSPGKKGEEQIGQDKTNGDNNSGDVGNDNTGGIVDEGNSAAFLTPVETGQQQLAPQDHDSDHLPPPPSSPCNSPRHGHAMVIQPFMARSAATSTSLFPPANLAYHSLAAVPFVSESINESYGRYIGKVLDTISPKNVSALKKDIADLIAKYEQLEA